MAQYSRHLFLLFQFLPTFKNIISVMKIGNGYLLFFVFVLLVATSCKEDDPQPLKAETQAQLLAGDKGSSKQWKLTIASIQDGSNPSSDITLETCILDNIYEFTNNEDQSYTSKEGATKCDPTDADILEAGNWTFTIDGKILIILPDVVNYSGNALFSFLTYPSEVIALTDSGMTLKMNIVNAGSSYSYTLTFVKV